MKNASDVLKHLVIFQLDDWSICRHIHKKKDGEEYDYMKRAEAYVDLAIFHGYKVEEEWMKSDREYHMRQAHLERENIKLERIIEETNTAVIVRGIAGIGKSTLFQNYILKWAYGEILNGEDGMPRIDFLFFFTCRELNELSQSEFSSSESMLEEGFPEVFKLISVEQLKDVSHRVGIFVDGIDEFRYLDEMKGINSKKHFNSSSPLTKAFYRLVEPHSSIFLEQKKVLLAGRPEACEIMKSVFSERVDTRMVEVCGFSEKSVNSYIDQTFKDKPELILTTKTKINESENLKAMSSVPVYLWIICLLFGEENTIESPKTTTELFIYGCLIYLCQHLKEKFQKVKYKLSDICQNNDILKLLLDVAKFSYQATVERKVVFDEKAVTNLCCSNIEDTGFVVRCCRDIKDKQVVVYQFRHLVLQEFLCALYIHQRGISMSTVLKTKQFRSCLPVLAGLQGLSNLNRDSSYTVQLFMQNIFKCNLLHRMRAAVVNMFTSQENLVSKLEKEAFTNEGDPRPDVFLVHNGKKKLKEFLGIFYEYQGEVSEYVLQLLTDKKLVVGGTLFAADSLYHHELLFILYFINKLPKTIDQFNFKMVDSTLSFNEIKEFATVLPKISKIKINNMNMSEEKWITLADGFSHSGCSLQTLYFTECNLANGVFEALQKVIPMLKKEFILFFMPPCNGHALKCISDSIMKYVSENGACQLQKLAINDCLVTDFSELMPGIKYLEEINLSGNAVSENDLILIADTLREVKDKSDIEPYNFKSLVLENCQLNDDKIINLKGSVKYLESLSISANPRVTIKTYQWLSDEIRNISQTHRNHLKTLSINECNINEEIVYCLCRCIPYLETISLTLNQLSTESINTISTSLQDAGEASLLKILDLKRCGINDEKCKILAPCICLLEELDISYNDDVTAATLHLLADVVTDSVLLKLKKIRINKTYFSEDEQNSFLEKLDKKVEIDWCCEDLLTY